MCIQQQRKQNVHYYAASFSKAVSNQSPILLMRGKGLNMTLIFVGIRTIIILKKMIRAKNPKKNINKAAIFRRVGPLKQNVAANGFTNSVRRYPTGKTLSGFQLFDKSVSFSWKRKVSLGLQKWAVIGYFLFWKSLRYGKTNAL